jgi:predicted TIM-barrel fold metal-dependent hydrolase
MGGAQRNPSTTILGTSVMGCAALHPSYNTEVGPPTYADATKTAQAFVESELERVVRGSDWPHPSAINKPDDALLFDLLSAWAPGEATRNRILAQNPEALYGFAKSA